MLVCNSISFKVYINNTTLQYIVREWIRFTQENPVCKNIVHTNYTDNPDSKRRQLSLCYCDVAY